MTNERFMKFMKLVDEIELNEIIDQKNIYEIYDYNKKLKLEPVNEDERLKYKEGGLIK